MSKSSLAHHVQTGPQQKEGRVLFSWNFKGIPAADDEVIERLREAARVPVGGQRYPVIFD